MYPPAALEAHALTKSFSLPGGGSVEVLHQLTCRIPAGRLTAVVGASGSGKSTALLCLSGLEPATSGTVSVLGQQLAGLPRAAVARLYRDRIGFVFQSYNLVPYLTVAENVALSDALAERRIDRDRVHETLAGLGLSAHRDALTTTLSGGEQQRVALARVLYRRPELVFADEPTGALDSRSAQFVLDRLHELAGRGHTVVLVTHDLTAAARADSVIVLRDGRIVEHRGRSTTAQLLAVTTAGGSR